MKHSPLALGLLLSAFALPAQSFFVPSDTPGTGTANAFPFNTTSMRYQTLVTAADLGGAPAVITGFAIAPSATGVRTFTSVTMKMAHTTATTLTTTFDTNLGTSATTTMDVANWAWKKTANVWNPVDFQVPFVFNGVDNVVVEFLVIGSGGTSIATRRDAVRQRVYQGSYNGQATGTDGGLTAFKMRFYSGDAQLGDYATGCNGSNSLPLTLTSSGASTLGASLTLDLTNAAATVPSVLHIGTTSATPYPLELSAIGAPGCFMRNNILLGVGMPTSASGTATFSLPVPNNTFLTNLSLYFQWAALDTGANALGITTSGYTRATFGN